MKNKQLKQKIEKITLNYIELFHDEYRLVVKTVAYEKEKNKDKFARIETNRVVQRKLYEIPETLYKMFIKQCSKEELTQMKDKESSKDFDYWFVKRFPEFGSSNIL